MSDPQYFKIEIVPPISEDEPITEFGLFRAVPISRGEFNRERENTIIYTPDE